MFKKSMAIIFMVAFFSCNNNSIPKPSGFLRLDYNEAKYAHFDNKTCPFTFDMNEDAVIKGKPNCGFEIHYPKMKATLYISYKSVHGDIKSLLRDAQKLTYDHVIKADDILDQPYLNPAKRVYGMFYHVNGNAATNAQFYVTDSTKHFLECSVYFYKKPNFDSIMPAASYIKNDMRTLMETLKWR
jgi:gliding motility-associated lipoprotein GldD